jgi:hypothetical protein
MSSSAEEEYDSNEEIFSGAESEHGNDSFDSGNESAAEVDIFNSLAGGVSRASGSNATKLSTAKGKLNGPSGGEGEDDADLADFIQSSIAKRNVKSGTDVLKKTKGKTKIAKGEIGGGSFQSMGKLSLC